MSGGAWRKSGKRRKERAGHPRHPSGTASFSHLPCRGSHGGSLTAGEPARPPLRALTLGLAELVVVLQPVAGRAAAVAPARLLQAVVRAAAVFRRAVGEAHLWADTEGAARAPRLYAPRRPRARGGPRPAAPAPSPCRQKRPSQPSAQSQRKPPRPSMHLPRPQHGRSHGLPEGRCSHWSPSATRGEEGVTRAAGPLPVLQRPGAPRGAQVWRPEVWSALTAILGPEGHLRREAAASGAVSPPVYMGSPWGPSPRWPGPSRAASKRAGERLPHTSRGGAGRGGSCVRRNARLPLASLAVSSSHT